MNSRTFREIIQLNKDFYDRAGEEFSKTRQSAWPGWGRVIKPVEQILPRNRKTSILDIGCGNGRFYEYLAEKTPKDRISYRGVDSSQRLLLEAKNKYKNMDARFEEMDVITKFPEFAEYYDVIVIFGVAHHIPSSKYREKWFNVVTHNLQKNGILVFTIWDFQNDPRYKNSIQSVKTNIININSKDLENGDFFLGWQNIKNVYRYCHSYSEDEISEILSILQKNGMKSVEDFYSDGRSGRLNRYFICQF
ncbi:hypothetical protein A2982_04020 [candidate division WWE3 bacterium RIFCSPLOWO2_01_FULL_39_13]|uniref:Methyltransferase domain-containing protein n=1 Tax=candidate division WWE3 bacterium RIFCSPLOWO2_01_FULL_39_13 TaxID=1802624 RepID=A0A1F4V2E1_UNCKA|nr:MAG: hypothetical protein A2982_04020 [candidate division WWE3 bacterium RIFCSPLOWO2_01_FULL_39_13]